VSCGHGGRALVADRIVWSLFCLLQLATLLRIAATLPVWPAGALPWLLPGAGQPASVFFVLRNTAAMEIHEAEVELCIG
jgi:hypothetical protein